MINRPNIVLFWETFQMNMLSREWHLPKQDKIGLFSITRILSDIPPLYGIHCSSPSKIVQ